MDKEIKEIIKPGIYNNYMIIFISAGLFCAGLLTLIFYSEYLYYIGMGIIMIVTGIGVTIHAAKEIKRIKKL